MIETILHYLQKADATDLKRILIFIETYLRKKHTSLKD